MDIRPLGVSKASKKVPLVETLKSQIRVKFEVLVPIGSQGAFQGPKLIIFEVIWECFGGRFWLVFDEVYVQVPVTVTSMSQHVLLEFFNYCYALQELSLVITSRIHLQHY